MAVRTVLAYSLTLWSTHMGYLYLVILLLTLSGAAWFWHAQLQKVVTRRSGQRGEDSDSVAIPRVLLAVTSIGRFVALGLIVLCTFFASMRQVPTGHVGVIYSFNRIVGQTQDGLQFILPWQTLRAASVQVQGHSFERLSSFSVESQVVDVAATLNISVSPDNIQRLYRTVGPNYFEVLVAPRVRQAFKDETVRYAATAIAPHREEIRRAVRDRLIRELSADSITVRDLLIDDIAFSAPFQASIEAKQVRTQDALREQAGIAVAEAQAAQTIARERGVGAAALARASQEAEANRQVAASLTPGLIQYRLNERLGPNIRVMVIPSNQPVIMNGADR